MNFAASGTPGAPAYVALLATELLEADDVVDVDDADVVLLTVDAVDEDDISADDPPEHPATIIPTSRTGKEPA